jgi:hypothetical protein
MEHLLAADTVLGMPEIGIEVALAYERAQRSLSFGWTRGRLQRVCYTTVPDHCWCET